MTLLLLASTTIAQNAASEKVFHRVMLINWADSLDNSAKTEVINLFLGLPDKIDGFKSIEINDLSKSTEDFEQVMILRFTSDEGIKTYGNHADHLRIQEISPPLISGFSLFEYWK
ncbi:MAG: Dabb family protein [Bacteroidetes bacterium]|nr:Dabb family protein [Bacteroidota bacterium]